METFCCQSSFGYILSLEQLRIRLHDLCALAWQWSVSMENEGRPHEAHSFVDIRYSNPGDDFAWDEIVYRFPILNDRDGYGIAELLVCLHPSSATAIKLPVYTEDNLQKVDPLDDFALFWASLKFGVTCCTNGGMQRYQYLRDASGPPTVGCSRAGSCCGRDANLSGSAT